ncbi:MAG: hypothetical protein FWG63_07930 [Defluviitaleaceae bacterium]|nr:hypothetical protein [Defluviitaleaceae bacterium]
MRKFNKKQILDILKTLEDMQDKKLYGECQEAALALCDLIDHLAESGTQTVALLEQYCEMLFKANNGEIEKKALRKHLFQIEDIAKEELKPNRTEVVFLSYKSSMSDCIESIYFAANADPQCDAYFIPIPYYEMLSNGQTGELIYEGAEFYDSRITITHYKNYNIEERCPDAIFHFNPYDDKNLTLMVHPDYHFKKLKKFTDMLVYIPYSFFGDKRTNVGSSIDFPGVIYSDKTILLSDDIKKGYAKELKKRNKKVSNSYLDNKFVALGSAKVDKVINSKKEDYEIPKEWAALIRDKRVILYNTSIVRFYRNGFKLMVQTLRAFKENRNVVLWWRPHPLLDVSVSIASPEHHEQYLKIINTYKAEGWGIFDDTPILHRAITFADAYYGDSLSGVFVLCAVAGKPCLKAERNKEGKEIFTMVALNDVALNDTEKYINTPKDFIEYICGDYAVSDERKSRMQALYAEDMGIDISGSAGQKIYEHIKSSILA